MELNILRERPAEFLVLACFDVAVDDFVVETSSYDMNLIAVFSGRKRKSGAHHSGSEDGDFLHFRNI